MVGTHALRTHVHTHTLTFNLSLVTSLAPRHPISTSHLTSACSRPHRPAAMSAAAAADQWDFVPLVFYVALPTMIRETITLNKNLTVRTLKELLEFLTRIKVADMCLYISAFDGFKVLRDDTKTLAEVGITSSETLVLYELTRTVHEEAQTDAPPPTCTRAAQTLFTAYEDPSDSAPASSSGTHNFFPGATIPLPPPTP